MRTVASNWLLINIMFILLSLNLLLSVGVLLEVMGAKFIENERTLPEYFL